MFCSLGLLALFALGKWCIVLLLLVSLYLAAFSWCLGVACGLRNIGFSGNDFVRGAMLGLTVDTGLATVLGFERNSHIFNVDVGSDFGVFLRSHAGMEKYAQSMLRFESLHALFALGVRTLFLRVDVLDPA